MKKIFALALAVVMAAGVLASCGSEDSSAAPSNTTAKGDAPVEEQPGDGSDAEGGDSTAPASDDGLKAPVSDSPIDVTQGCTENMLIRSVHFEGDTTRLAAKLKEAMDPDAKKLTNIVFLGDSITAGSTVSNSKYAYVNQFEKWWKENVSVLYKIHNEGIGATDSYYGTHRVERDVYSDEPDIIFVEFINDAGNEEFYKETMDSLIRKCLAYESKPAVVLLEMSLEGGGNAQDSHAPVGEKYGVPVLSYHDAIYPEVEAGNFLFTTSKRKPADKDGVSSDGTHPNDWGHTMVCQIISNFLQGVIDNIDSYDTANIPEFDPESESLTGDLYRYGKVSDSTTGDITVTSLGDFTETSTPYTFPNGWSTGKGGTITFEMEFRNLGMVYYKTVDGKTGIAKVNIDGEDVADVNGDFTGGWGNYGTNIEVYRSDETAKHTVTVTVEPGDQDDFEVLAWLIS